MSACWQLAFLFQWFFQRWQKAYLLTSFGRAAGFFSDLAMCMALAWAF